LAKIASTLLFISLFFFSCEEDINTVGFKPDRGRFRVRYAEIELPSSVMLTGPLVTSNFSGDSQTPRLLVGDYTDEKFGKINAEAYMQFRPSSVTALPSDAALESLELQLTFDYYNYGSQNPAGIEFSVHELTDSLITESTYYNSSTTDYSPAIIGTASYYVDPVYFNDRAVKNLDPDTTKRTIDVLKIPLSQSYADKLFLSAKGNTDEFTSFRKFRRIFKGLAIKSNATNTIVGFNPSYSTTGNYRSRLIMYYRYADSSTGASTRGKLEFYIYQDQSGSISYSKISADLSGSPLQSMDELYKSFYPDGDTRFLQAGNAVVTKFDLSQFFSYTDTISNVLINSAELVIDPVETSSYKLPDNIGVRILNVKNQFLTTSDTIPSEVNGQIVTDANGLLILGEASSSTSVSIRSLLLSQTDNINKYNQSFTRYFQSLYSISDKTKRPMQYALVPISPRPGRSVNRLVFNKNNFKLRLYFTTPTGSKKE
jgi:hypothetical protein